ncbi:MAG TPA: Gfo/Idh/MocA family oxidoreductase [Candidatus Limicola stercorigallinarum]|nr:Gfo/Idh/MocA family oxidoreductase [Candidatus Limicola stercorigallinarum]
MKLGMVGTGMIAQTMGPHLGAWGCPLTALCSTPRSLDRARELAQVWGVAEVFSDYAAMLEQADVDTVYIAVPNHLHASFTLQALAAGKHVIVEKPFASTDAEVAQVIEEARTRDLLVYEAVSTLYLPNYLRIKEWLPRIGTVKIVTCNYSQYSSRYDAFCAGTVLPAFNPAMSGGALMDLGVYNLNYIMGLFGAPQHVAYAANVDRGIDTSGVAILDYGAFKAVSICAKDCGAPTTNVIQGTNGYIMQTTPANRCGAVTLHLNDGTEEVFDESPELQWESEFRAFAAGIEAGDRAGCAEKLEHSLAVARVLTEARRQAGVVFPADKA